jgi:cation diffusion facilitator family transporter
MDATEKEHGTSGARLAVIAALFGNLGVAAMKFVAWIFTGSSAMLAESIHSVADTVNQGFLLLGLRLERRLPTAEYPFGFGRERYFWAFIVAVSIFALGAVFSIYEGIHKMRHPTPIENAGWSFAALGVAVLFESYALRIAWKELGHWRERNPGSLWRGLTTTKSPTILVVLFEDSAALLGISIATVGIGLALVTGNTVWDGLASLGIGIILFLAAWFIGWRTRNLLLGEAATPADRERIRAAVLRSDAVLDVVELLTLHLGPSDILVNLALHFRDGLTTDEVEAAVDEIETNIRVAVPAARRIFIEAESLVRRNGAPAAGGGG